MQKKSGRFGLLAFKTVCWKILSSQTLKVKLAVLRQISVQLKKNYMSTQRHQERDPVTF